MLSGNSGRGKLLESFEGARGLKKFADRLQLRQGRGKEEPVRGVRG